MLTIDQLREISASYKLELIEVDDEFLERIGQDWSVFENASWITYPATIQVGRYGDDEKRAASVFHEIGHSLAEVDVTGPDHTVQHELVVWMVGLREAARHGLFFSPETIQWALEQALSYKGRK